jgi:hypothetical protein
MFHCVSSARRELELGSELNGDFIALFIKDRSDEKERLMVQRNCEVGVQFGRVARYLRSPGQPFDGDLDGDIARHCDEAVRVGNAWCMHEQVLDLCSILRTPSRPKKSR